VSVCVSPLTCAGARHTGATPSTLTAYFREKEREEQTRGLEILKDFAKLYFVCDVAAREISDAHPAANLNTFINTIFTCIYKIYHLCKVKQKFKISKFKAKVYLCSF